MVGALKSSTASNHLKFIARPGRSSQGQSGREQGRRCARRGVPVAARHPISPGTRDWLTWKVTEGLRTWPPCVVIVKKGLAGRTRGPNIAGSISDSTNTRHHTGAFAASKNQRARLQRRGLQGQTDMYLESTGTAFICFGCFVGEVDTHHEGLHI